MKTKTSSIKTPASIVVIMLLTFTCTAFFSYAENKQENRDEAKFTVGVGIASLPKFSGASENETRFLPLISIRYGRLSIGGVDGIAYDFFSNNGLSVSGTIGYFRGRDESDAEYLRGLGSIESSATAGIAISKSMGSWRVGLSASRDFSDDVGGVTAGLSGSYSHKISQQLHLILGSSISWMNSSYASGVYGIADNQAIISTLPAFSAAAGVERVGLSLTGLYFINQHWTLTTVISQSQLLSDAKSSPISRKTDPYFIMTGISYRF